MIDRLIEEPDFTTNHLRDNYLRFVPEVEVDPKVHLNLEEIHLSNAKQSSDFEA